VRQALDMDVPEFEAWAEQFASRHGYSDIEHTVEITGVCSDCAAKAR
jgi:Fur family ferric uptake transcriptional regulator